MNDVINNITVFGDWHGVGKYAEKALYRLQNLRRIPDIYLHVGDFGFSRHYRFHHLVNNIVAKQEREMWVVLGNHEDYDWIETFPKDERGLIKVLDNLYVIPRGYRWTWNSVDFAALGGAYSIDRRWRTLGKSWWEQEVITQEDFEKTIAGGDTDILISHEGPWLPFGKNPRLDFLTRKQERDSKRNRDFIARTILETNAKMNIHGHHHASYERCLRGCLVVGLANDGNPLDENSYNLNLDDFKKKTGK